MRKLANEALAGDMTLDAFKTRCLTEVVAAKPAAPVLIADVANGEDVSSYSMLRGIHCRLS